MWPQRKITMSQQIASALVTIAAICLAAPLVLLAAFSLAMRAAHQHDFQGEKK